MDSSSFAERRTLISARVPSRFNRSLKPIVLMFKRLGDPYKTLHPLLGEMMYTNLRQNVISDFRHGLSDIFVLPGRYAAQVSTVIPRLTSGPANEFFG